MRTKETARRALAPEETHESDLVAQRRKAADSSDANRQFQGDCGLALSGGGIRSATFCLGLLRALAKARSLRHVDYLSTVSGGGYVGAAFTRLYGAQRSAADVEQGLARDDSVFLWWLRNNGRYLTPAGFTDVMQAVAYIFRGSLASHVEFAMIVAFAVAGLLLPDVVSSAHGGGWLPSVRDEHMSVWWWIAAASTFLIALQVFAYWFRRAPTERSVSAVDVVVALGALAAAWRYAPAVRAYLDAQSPSWPSMAAVAAYAVLPAAVVAMAVRIAERKLPLGEARLKHTKALAGALKLFFFLVAAGALDVATYEIANWLEFRGDIVAASLPSVAALAAAGHWARTHWKAGREVVQSVVRALGLSRSLNLLGLAFLAFVVGVWTVALQWLFQFDHAWMPLWAGDSAHVMRWLLVFTAPVAYVIATLGGIETLNLSSLHNFYRARLERAYVSTGNGKRFGDAILHAKAAVQDRPDMMRVAAAVAGDDVALAHHRPHAHGGPLHLVNCCINQTVDDRTDAYNADRKGVALTVSALGVETGTNEPDRKEPPDSLSKWVAISGAAASSGMGSQTTPGAAAFLFLSALRLGYWQRALDARRRAADGKMTRPMLLLAECFARFPGLRSAQWYLSDGGHFENTAVYALLKRQLDLIVVADCGADPGYGFEDLENLVRKAAIDYSADIRFFLPPPDASDLRRAIGLPRTFGGDSAIASRTGPESLLLARIRYLGGKVGTLVVVKPRVVPGLAVDTANYAAANAVFPQQTTADQFFDEAQWEAYHRLGLRLGEVLTPANLQRLQAWALA